MAPIDLDSLVSRAEGFTTAAVHNELMMLNVNQGVYYSLDPIASEIWNLLEQPMQVESLADQLQKRYAVSVEQCRADVLEFLEKLRENGMILVR
jgi:hypothetical protein